VLSLGGVDQSVRPSAFEPFRFREMTLLEMQVDEVRDHVTAVVA
jgi:hypothetical protein